MHVVLAGGGTAGHIEPALNTADALRARDCAISLSVLGTEKGLETTLVPARGYQLTLIDPVPLPRRINKDLLSLPMRLKRAITQVAHHLNETNADVVVGFGGYVALPAYLACRKLGVPFIVHEANAKPGLANRIGARFASAVVETVSGSFSGALHYGLPLRHAIRTFNKMSARSAGQEIWSLDTSRPTLLVFGGSQGSRKINDVIAQAAPTLTAQGWNILHSVGSKNLDHIQKTNPHYVTVPYIDRMDFAYGVADVALCRSGAMTVAELSAVGLPAIYVPLPIGNGEQRLNALEVVAAGGGVIVEDEKLTAELVLEQLRLWNAVGLEQLSAAARSVSHAEDIEKFVSLILQTALKKEHRA